MTETQKRLRDEAAKQQGDNHACPIIRSMYPSKSRGEMSREFAQLYSLGHDFAHERARVLVEALEKIANQDYRGNAPVGLREARAALAEWRGDK